MINFVSFIKLCDLLIKFLDKFLFLFMKLVGFFVDNFWECEVKFCFIGNYVKVVIDIFI